jgi:hypothetical protein
MFGLVVAVLLSWLGAMGIGTVTGSFSLTLVALVGLLVTGAMGVSMRMTAEEQPPPLPAAEVHATPAGPGPQLRSIPSQQPRPAGRPHEAAAPRRAA